MPTADFSNQAYVEDDAKSRMVLSDFAGDDCCGRSDFGYSHFSYGDSESFEMGEQVNQLAARGVPTTRQAELLKAIGSYHHALHQAESHPMSGFHGGFEGFGAGFFDSVVSSIKKAGSQVASQTVTAAKRTAVQTVQSGVKQVTSTPQAQQIAKVAETIKKDPVVAEALKDPAKAPGVLADVQKKAQEVVSAAVTTIAANKIPTALVGLGALGALYFFFLRKK